MNCYAHAKQALKGNFATTYVDFYSENHYRLFKAKYYDFYKLDEATIAQVIKEKTSGFMKSFLEQQRASETMAYAKSNAERLQSQSAQASGKAEMFVQNMTH